MKKLDISVLYVEDDLDIVEEVSFFLQKRVAKLIVAKDGEEGLQKFYNNTPDVVITDIQMPKKDGLSMAEEMRRSNEMLPVVIVSAYNDTEFLNRAIAIDIDGYLLKPLDFDKLYKTLHRVSKPLLLERELREKNKRLTELLQQKEEELSSMDELLSRIFVASNEALVILEEGIIVNINEAAKKMFAVEDESSYLGKIHTIDTFVPQLQPDGTPSKEIQDYGYATAVKNGFYRTELQMRRYNGELFWADLLLTNLHNAKRETVLVSIRNIDKQKELEHQLRRLAMTDTLTGIRNRRSFFLEAEAFLRTTEGDVFALMIDIDDFKKINDTYGHEAGDLVLRSVTQEISGFIEKRSIFGRIGGEEFSIICSANSKEVKVCIEGIVKEISELKIAYNAQSISVTLSIGAAAREYRDEDIDTLLQRADKKLYQAKQEGKNRVVF